MPIPKVESKTVPHASVVQATVRVFTLPQGTPAGAPQRGPDVVVEATTRDGLRDAARAALAAPGRRLRALSFTPTGLVAYLEVTE